MRTIAVLVLLKVHIFCETAKSYDSGFIISKHEDFNSEDSSSKEDSYSDTKEDTGSSCRNKATRVMAKRTTVKPIICKTEYDVNIYQGASWYKATILCRNKGTELVSIKNQQEMESVKLAILKLTGSNGVEFWTSGSDEKKEGFWEWTGIKAPFTYTNWEHREPNNDNGGEHCLLIKKNFAWNDFPCEKSLSFICERRVCE